MERSQSSPTSGNLEDSSSCFPWTTYIRSPAARAEALTALQKETVGLEKFRLRTVYAQINTLLPISLLPPELLSRVFRFLQDEDNSLVSSRQLGWVAVTHVCRQWRRLVALGDASLWGRIGGPRSFHQKWFLEMLARSKCAPIDVTISLPVPPPETLHVLSYHISRVRTLFLCCYGPCLYDAKVHALLRSEAPVIEELNMMASRAMMPTAPVGVERAPRTSDLKLFGGQAPKLRKICLSYFCLPWRYFPKCILTHLQVSINLQSGFNHIFGQPLGSLNQFIDVLADNSSTLESLYLDDCLPSLPQQLPRTGAVELPRLYQLHLKGPSSRVTHLFKLLKMPSLIHLFLHPVTWNREEVASWPTIVPIAMSCLDRVELPTFGALVLMIDSLTTMVYASSTASAFDTRVPLPDQVKLLLTFQNDSMSEGRSNEIAQEVCAPPRMAKMITRLDVTALRTEHPTDWADLFRSFAEVTTLKVSGSKAVSLLQAMTLQKHTPPAAIDANNTTSHPEDTQQWTVLDAPSLGAAGAGAKPLLFPQLMSLHLNSIDFRTFIHGTDTPFHLVSDLISLRSGPDAKIDELIITECMIDAAEAFGLGDLVNGKFEWDGDERLSSEASDSDDTSDGDDSTGSTGSRDELSLG
ncbi:hypothetical protein BC834DRAFT_881129 [Gloeopeniophorella convolvens]|nr:hypothetical protein BC834DRAFT_881129 [Gloeopeniophorella convolvens]